MNTFVIIFYAIWIALAIAVGKYAKGKGKLFWAFFFGSIFVTPLIAFIIAAIVPATEVQKDRANGGNGSGRRCVFCSERIQKEALICSHCNRPLPTEDEQPLFRKVLSENPEILGLPNTEIIQRIRAELAKKYS